MTEISNKRKEELRKLAHYRAEEIQEDWWWECVGEWQEEEDLSDKELDYALGVGIDISLTPIEDK